MEVAAGATTGQDVATQIAGAQEAPFTLELSQDQKDVRDWVHGFAEGVVRPAAAEWDEREETPWPIIQEAAKIGLYGFESLAQFWGDPSGLTLPIVNEELFWGDAGIGMSIMGTSLAVAAIFGQGTPEQIMEWIPQCFGTPEEPAVVVPPGTQGLTMGTKVKKHGLRASHTADVFLDECRVPGACLLGGKEKLDERMARAREGTRSRGQAAMQTFEASRPTVGAQALGIARAAYEYALEYAKERVQFGRPIIDNQAIAFALADMKLEIDASRLLVWRASWMGRQGKRFENAEGSMSKLKAGGGAV